MSDDNANEPTLQPFETTPASPAVEAAQAEAKANSKAEGTPQAAKKLEEQRNDNLESARKTAQINHDAGDEAQPNANQTELKNDTSKKAKIDTTKAQLDPTGSDPISKAELERAATDGASVKGGTSVTDEEQARRANAGNNSEDLPTEDAAGNPTLGNGVINPPADADALHPGGGKADGSAKSSSDSADKS